LACLGPHFRDYHLLLDDQAVEIYATTDDLAERVRRIGGRTIHSISEISRLQSIKDNDKPFVSAKDMLKELMADTKTVIKAMRAAHEVADKHDDVASASILENFIDAAESATGSCSRPAAPVMAPVTDLKQRKE